MYSENLLYDKDNQEYNSQSLVEIKIYRSNIVKVLLKINVNKTTKMTRSITVDVYHKEKGMGSKIEKKKFSRLL